MKLHCSKYLWGLVCALLFVSATFAGCGKQTQTENADKQTESVDKQTENAGSKPGDAGKQTGDADKQTENAGSQTGDADKQSGDAGKQTGNTDKGADQEMGKGKDNKTNMENGMLPALAVDGTRLVDSQGNPVQLRGISTHGLAWFPDYVNEECFRQLKDEWGIDVIRLAMYTAENGGYCSGGDQESLKKLVKNGVQYATDCGLYVIIDWHILSDGNPNTHIDEAKEFFSEMSEAYADYTNVIYEICNEPNGGTTWKDVKDYAEQIIEVIRKNDSDGLILVGTPNWCQFVDQAAKDPIEDCENVMYTLHFYAATHTESLRNTMAKAIEDGLAIFVSEYGICDASGNGAIDRTQADEWIKLLDSYGVSYVAWNLSNKDETSALIKSSCSKRSGFTTEDLSESGKWLYELLNGEEAAGVQAGQAETASDGADSTAGICHLPKAGQAEAADDSEKQDEVSFTDPQGMEITVVMVNSWDQNGERCSQYSVTIKNSSGGDCSQWSIELPFDGGVELQDIWNSKCDMNGSTLVLSNQDYNGAIAADESLDNVGFIVKGSGRPVAKN